MQVQQHQKTMTHLRNLERSVSRGGSMRDEVMVKVFPLLFTLWSSLSLNKLTSEMAFIFTLCHLQNLQSPWLGLTQGYRADILTSCVSRCKSVTSPFEEEGFVLFHQKKLHKPQICLLILSKFSGQTGPKLESLEAKLGWMQAGMFLVSGCEGKHSSRSKDGTFDGKSKAKKTH